MKELTKQEKLDATDDLIHQSLHSRGLGFICHFFKDWLALKMDCHYRELLNKDPEIAFPEFYQMINRVGKQLYKKRGNDDWREGDAWQISRAKKVKYLERLRTKIEKL